MIEEEIQFLCHWTIAIFYRVRNQESDSTAIPKLGNRLQIIENLTEYGCLGFATLLHSEYSSTSDLEERRHRRYKSLCTFSVLSSALLDCRLR